MASPISFKRNRRSSRGVVGLDIEPGYVAAVQASVNGGVRVEQAAGASLDLDVVREGEVVDVDALGVVLHDLFRESGLSRKVRLGLANQRTVLRMLELPPITDRKELATAVRFRADEEVPMPLHNAVLDFHDLGVFETPSGPRQRVVLVAAQRDMVEKLLAAVRAAGLRPEGVDLSAFAMIRALYHPDLGADTRRVYLSVGGLTNMAVADGIVCRFTRVLGGGLESMAAEVAERRGVPLVEARELLRVAGLPEEPPPPATELAIPPAPRPAQALEQGDAEARPDTTWSVPRPASALDELSAPAIKEDRGTWAEEMRDMAAGSLEDVRRVLIAGVRHVAGEVRNSLDYQRARDSQGTQDRSEAAVNVVLSGPSLEVPGFVSALERELGMPVQPGVVATERPGIDGIVPLDRLAVAAGLAAEEVTP